MAQWDLDGDEAPLMDTRTAMKQCSILTLVLTMVLTVVLTVVLTMVVY